MKNVVLVLGVFSAIVAGQRQQNWVGRKFTHDANRLPGAELDYFANQLKTESDFGRHLRHVLVPRVPGTPGSAKVREYIADEMRRLGWNVEISSSRQKTPDGNLDFHNVIATLDANAPRRLVLACHYDSKKTPDGFLGATDSAVPCSQMLNLAHAMRFDLADHKAKVM